jgi:hypothetical protein
MTPSRIATAGAIVKSRRTDRFFEQFDVHAELFAAPPRLDQEYDRFQNHERNHDGNQQIHEAAVWIEFHPNSPFVSV